MRSFLRDARRRPIALISMCTMLLLFGVMGSDCPGGGDNGNENGGTPGAPTISIRLTTDLDIPSDTAFTIVYDLSGDPTEAIAFYDADGIADTGDEVVLAPELASGTGQTFLFDTPAIPLGTYFIGIKATNGSGTTTQYAVTSDGSAATVRVNGAPQPTITSPSSTMEVLVGEESASVDLVFSCNDPEDEVAWQIFFDLDTTVDGSETVIDSGTANASSPDSDSQTANWLISTGADLGTYNIGLTCIETSESRATVTFYSDAQVIVTDVLPVPVINLVSPSSDVVFGVGDDEITFEVTWTTSGTEPTAEDVVTLFVDTDKVIDDGTEIPLADDLSPLDLTATIDTELADDTYFIGGYVTRDDLRSNPSYADGKLVISRGVNLAISSPSAPLTIRPGIDVSVRWTTNVGEGQATLALSLWTSDQTGTLISEITGADDPFSDLKEMPTTERSTTLETLALDSGYYVIQLSLTPEIPEIDAATAVSGLLRVTTLPTVLWVGSIELNDEQEDDPPLGHFDGIVFQGFNFEDNAGSTLLGLSEAQGFPDDFGFIIGARYAKPLFANPDGKGQGEAYLVYDSIIDSEINRAYPLNTVGTKRSPDDDDPNALYGLRFSGIAFDSSPEDINDNDVIDILSEDLDGDGRLDEVDEEAMGSAGLDCTPTGECVEDVDGDGILDFAEDGCLGIDADPIDGIVDNLATVLCDPYNGIPNRTVLSQFVNGALDTYVTEDRDGDEQLDEVGDATWGLTTVGLLPDADGDGLPELSFGFEFTDSLEADFREQFGFGSEESHYGSLTQENHFERGGIVMVPTLVEPTILNPFVLGRRDLDRTVELDAVGQNFGFPSGEDTSEDDPADTPGIPDEDPAGGSQNGMHVFPWVRNSLGEPDLPTCTSGDSTVTFVNNMNLEYAAVAKWNVKWNNGTDDVEEPYEVPATPDAYGRACVPDPGFPMTFEPDGVDIYDPDRELVIRTLTSGNGQDLRTAPIRSLGGDLIQGVTGSRLAAGQADSVTAMDFKAGRNSPFGHESCDIDGTDDCLETMVGPFFGFYYDRVASMEVPTHPLAYRRTLANPIWRQNWWYPDMSRACDADCGRVLPDSTTVREGTAPPFNFISTGYYEGKAESPHGARLLGEGVGDRFGKSISRGLGINESVFVGAPMRSPGGKVDAGVVYQFMMAEYWNSSNDLANLNDSDKAVPKPHQFIMKEVGSARPGSGGFWVDSQRDFLDVAIIYSGADAEDNLGEVVLGIEDFNGDVLSDLVMGAPGAAGQGDAVPDSGAVYIIYRQTPRLEASVSLDKIELPPDNPNRLTGLLINGDAGDQLGRVVAGNCDLNDDGDADLVIGNPLHEGGDGEVIVVFGGPGLTSPEDGYLIQELLDDLATPRAIRIQGLADRAGQVGFAVTCDGDFDGDGNDDLVLSAPFDTPQYDKTGNDDIPETDGLDLNGDGIEDGLYGDQTGDAAEAGLVYVILNVADIEPGSTVNLSEMGSSLQGFIFAGREGGDNLGGGFDSKPDRMTRGQGLTFGGDINRDGKDDLLLGSMLADPVLDDGVPVTNAGEVYVVFGLDQDEAEDILEP